LARSGKKIHHHIETIAQAIVGADPTTIEGFLNRWHNAHMSDKNWCAAVSAIEIALRDIVGKVANLPIYALLGGPVTSKIPLYADHEFSDGAGEGIRTLDVHLGKVVLYQLSYSRKRMCRPPIKLIDV
jgi:L-alanine-DL-glutamate epimerase-like enolase superfamily enzyme